MAETIKNQWLINSNNEKIAPYTMLNQVLDSKTGRVRLRANGSSGGHNGLKSIESQVGTQEYKRIKIGIDRSNVIPVIDWVLQEFTQDELAQINQAIEVSKKACIDFTEGKDFYRISSTYSTK